MNYLSLSILGVFVFPSLISASLGELDFRDRMVRDINFIHSMFETKYAPARWKKAYSNWDLAIETDRAKAEILARDRYSIKDYQRTLRRFFNSTKDYHVGVSFHATEESHLPFDVCGASGHYYITAIDRDQLPKRMFGFDLGDELVLFDGKPVDLVIQEIKNEELSNASPDTEQALAELFLTRRASSQGFIVPRGPISIAVRSRRTGQVMHYQTIWNYCPERIINPTSFPLSPKKISSVRSPKNIRHHPYLNRKMVMPMFDSLSSSRGKMTQHPNEIGARESFVPLLGETVWETDPNDSFYGYIFKHPNSGKLIGCVRIPHYIGDAMQVDQFARIIAEFEVRTEALVIDQVNNPGGMVFYLYALASMLSDQPLATPRHRIMLTQQDIAFAVTAEPLLALINSDDEARETIGDVIQGYPITYQFVQFWLHSLRFVIDEWNQGRTLTCPTYLYGVDHINSNPEVNYTKPILMLINRLDFSGGDFLAAILQDNKRVKLFGSRTAGAGGFVDGYSYPNMLGVAFVHFTGSIAERLDNNPIENLGVQPDIPYELSEIDLQEGYIEYKRAVLNALLTL